MCAVRSFKENQDVVKSEGMEEFDSSDKGVKNAPTYRSILFRILFS